MTDIQDGDAVARHPPQIVVQQASFAGVEAGSGLVEYDDARAKITRADDSGHLPAMQSHAAKERIGRWSAGEHFRPTAELGFHFAPLATAQETSRLLPQHHVLRSRQIGKKWQLLVHDADPNPLCALWP